MMQSPISFKLSAAVSGTSGSRHALRLSVQKAVGVVAMGLFSLSALSTGLFPAVANAAGEIDSVSSSIEPSTPFRYTLGGIEYTWGVSGNQVLDSFTFNGNTYPYRLAADNVIVRRVDRAGVTSGQPCSVFAERERDYTRLRPDYPRNVAAGTQCDVARMLQDPVINRGVLNVFSNTGPEPKNIERIDFVFARGITAPLDAQRLAAAGHIVAEKRGNNRVQMAAITALDDSGNPVAYGPLVMVREVSGCSGDEICYGVTPVVHDYSFFRTNAVGGTGDVFHFGDSTESLAMAFVGLDRLGVAAGQQYYGFSYFGRDVDASVHTLTDPGTFPADSADDFIKTGDGADIYGGVAGYFVPDSSSTIFGSVFADINENGIQEENESGLENITVMLFADTNLNGTLDADDQLAGAPVISNAAGDFVISGIPDGLYFLQLDENDADLPTGATLSEGANPIVISAPISTGSTFDFAVALPMNDGTGPMANADTVILNQDEPEIIPVLANDVDGSGTGLTVVDVTGIENGSAIINPNGTITFTPAPGFTGETAFMYVVEDGNGVQSTATVSATVVPFSDINLNGLNDFVECGCTDLGLITGIHGSGTGKLGFLLLVLTSLAGYRLRRTMRSAGETS